MFPVPLNSSKMTSSIFEPVSTSAVARIGQRAAVLDVARGTEEPLGRVQRRWSRRHRTGCGRTPGRPGCRRGRAGSSSRAGRRRRGPSSTRRLARSMASSATVVWSSAGRSKVEAMTSPLTVRCMSVTSSGRSSTSTTMRCTSGLFVVIAFAIDCSTMVLPALGGETIRPRWPLPIGATRSMTRVVRLPGSVSRRSRSCGYSGRQLVEVGPAAGLLGVGAVDGVEPDQRVELLPALALPRLPDRAGDGVALAQAVLAHLDERDVHVVGAGQVAGGADERVVVEDVEDAGDRHEDVVLADRPARPRPRSARARVGRRSRLRPRRRRRPRSPSASSS